MIKQLELHRLGDRAATPRPAGAGVGRGCGGFGCRGLRSAGRRSTGSGGLRASRRGAGRGNGRRGCRHAQERRKTHELTARDASLFQLLVGVGDGRMNPLHLLLGNSAHLHDFSSGFVATRQSPGSVPQLVAMKSPTVVRTLRHHLLWVTRPPEWSDGCDKESAEMVWTWGRVGTAAGAGRLRKRAIERLTAKFVVSNLSTTALSAGRRSFCSRCPSMSPRQPGILHSQAAR